jgi:MFS family permease
MTVEQKTQVGRGVLLATCVSTLVVNANTSAVTILLPAISEDTGTSTATLQWAVTGYSLVGAAVVVTAGVLGDIAGRRRIFVGGLWLFVASCAFIALSRNGAGVIAGRAIQGAAGSTLLACGLSLLSVAATGAAQMRAVAYWGAASAAGAALGPLLGGALVDTVGWQALFWVDATIALLCVPLTLRTVQESSDPGRPRKVDLAGTLLIAATLVPLVLAFSEGPSWGWTSPATLLCLAASVVAGAAFVAVERRLRLPLIDLRLLGNRVLLGTTVVILIVAGTVNGLMYVISLYFQDPAGLGMSPFEAGLATLPAAAGLVVVSPFVSSLAERIGSRNVIGLGFVIATLAFGTLLFAGGSWPYSKFVLPLIAVAVGLGLANGCASAGATASVESNEVGAASGLSNMARYVGAAVLTALAATIYAGAPAGQPGHGVTRSSLLMTLVCLLGVGIAVLYGRHRPRHAQAVDRAAAAAAVAHTVPGSH